MDRSNEITAKFQGLRDLIELAMMEFLEANGNSIGFEHPIEVVNNECYDTPGTVYAVMLCTSNDAHKYLLFQVSWGSQGQDEAEDYGFGDFMTDDLEWIYERMLEENNEY